MRKMTIGKSMCVLAAGQWTNAAVLPLNPLQLSKQAEGELLTTILIKI